MNRVSVCPGYQPLRTDWKYQQALSGCTSLLNVIQASSEWEWARSRATELTAANVDEKVAHQLLGLRTTSIFRRYNITRKEHLEDAARKLARYWKVQRRHTLDIPDEEASS